MAHDSHRSRLRHWRSLVLILALAALAATLGGTTALGAKKARPATLDTAKLPGYSASARALARREARRTAALRTPAARKARARSRRAFRGLGRSGALRTARQAFPQDLGRKAWRGPKLAPGQRIKGYLDRSTALVDAGAHDAVAAASFPLLTERGEAVDMALLEQGTSLAPKTPLVALRIARSPKQGATVGSSGLGIAPAGGTGEPATLVSDKAFYANVATDTDLIVEPTLTGVETFHQLRSPASPEDPALDLRLPPGAKLRPAPAPAIPGSLEVVRGSDRLVLIDPPAAIDADGRNVPVRYRTEGAERLVLDVPHRSGEFRYPILVDPDAHVWEDFRGWPDTNHWEAVSYGNWAVGPYAGTPFSNAALGCAECHYGAGQWQQFRWPTTAGSTVAAGRYRDSFVFRADTSVDYTPNGTRLSQGFWPDQGWELASTNSLGGHTRTLCIRDFCGGAFGDGTPNGSDGNFFFHSLEVTVPGWRYGARSQLNWALFMLHEKHPPSVGNTNWRLDGAGFDTNRWAGPNRTLTASTPASDRGLGLRQGELVYRNSGALVTPGTRTYEGCYANVGAHDTSPDTWGGAWHGQTTPGPDQGDRNNACPTARTYDWNVSTNSLNEGSNHVGVDAWDIVGRKAAVTNGSFVKVDRTAPVLTPSGELWDELEEAYISEDATMHVRSDDSHSGVESIRFTVDGTEVLPDSGGSTQSCTTGGCPGSMDRDYTFRPLLYTEGRHELKLVTKDQVGQTTTDTWYVYVDKTPRAVPDVATITAVYDLEAAEARLEWDSAVDPLLTDGTPGSGELEDQFRYQQDDGTWTEWEPRDPEGAFMPGNIGTIRTVEVRTVDNAGNASAASSSMVVVQPDLGEAQAAPDCSPNGGSNVLCGPDAHQSSKDANCYHLRDQAYGDRKIPACRDAKRGTVDFGKQKVGSKYQRLTGYRFFHRYPRMRANSTGPANGRNMWPLVNSNGQTFAWIDQKIQPNVDAKKNATRQFVVYRANGTTLFGKTPGYGTQSQRDRTSMRVGVQGKACMLATGSDAAGTPYKDYVMVVTFAVGYGKGPGRGANSRQYIGVRGFMSPKAFPTNMAPPGKPAQTIDDIVRARTLRTGCHGQDLGFNRSPSDPDPQGELVNAGETTPSELMNTRIPFVYQYDGDYKGAPRPTLEKGASPRYANYAGTPIPNLGPETSRPTGLDVNRVEQVKLQVNTTGVDGGGIVRAILPRNQAYTQVDRIGYLDPNGFCRQQGTNTKVGYRPLVQWAVVRINGTDLEGFVPVNRTSTFGFKHNSCRDQ